MRLFKCDFCGRTQEQTAASLPDEWTRIEFKLKDYGVYIFKLDACPGCSIYQRHFTNQREIVKLLIAIKNGAEK